VATADDAVSAMLPQFVAEPDNENQLASALSLANEAGMTVVPRGGATKLDWGNPPKKVNLILSTARLNRIVEHAWADLTVTAEAGCTLQSLQHTLAQHGQRLAFDGLWPERVTIGGVLSANDSGALRLRFGALRDLIIGVTIALPDGTLASSGGKVVKNVAGYDLPKLVTGALGTLGVITRAVFRLASPSARCKELFLHGRKVSRPCSNTSWPFKIPNWPIPHCKFAARPANPPPLTFCSKPQTQASPRKNHNYASFSAPSARSNLQEISGMRGKIFGTGQPIPR